MHNNGIVEKEYKNLSVIELVLDDGFRQIVKGQSDTSSLSDLLREYPNKRRTLILASRIVLGLIFKKTRISTEKKSHIWAEIQLSHKKSIRLSVFKYAASIIAFLFIVAGSYYYMEMQPSISKFAKVQEFDRTKSKLILADGNDIVIPSSESVVEYSSDGKSVSVDNDKEHQQEIKDDGFNQLIVPFGKRSSVVLSDGTTVWINSGSRLVYPPQFSKKSREVFVEGEAYFDVTKDESRPFIVRTDAFSLKVVGTKFNIQAFTHENEFNATLLEGRVDMNTNNRLFSEKISLSPSQKVSLTKDANQFVVEEVKYVDDCVSWIHGHLSFKNESLKTLLKKVSRYYNIEIDVLDDDDLTYISGKLDLKDDPERILDGIAIFSKMRYEKKGNKYVYYR